MAIFHTPHPDDTGVLAGVILGLLVTLLAVLAVGCSGSPIGPSTMHTHTTSDDSAALLVIVRDFGNGNPIPGASVHLESHLVGHCNDRGEIIVIVPLTHEVLVSAAAVGFTPSEWPEHFDANPGRLIFNLERVR